MARPQKVVAYLLSCRLADLPGPRGVFEKAHHIPSILAKVSWIVDQQAGPTVIDLVLDTADPARDDGAVLPHRLGHRQAESFGKTLLDDHFCVTLKSVHDGGVLFRIDHWQDGKVNRTSGRRWQSVPCLHRLLQDLPALGSVSDRVNSRPSNDQMSVDARGYVIRESTDDANWILQVVPTRHLHHQPIFNGGRRNLNHPGPVQHRRLTSVLPFESGARGRPPAEYAGDRKDGLDLVAAHLTVLR